MLDSIACSEPGTPVEPVLRAVNQFRFVLHTAAYWLMLALRDAVRRRMDLAWAEFATIRRSQLKIGARVVEKAARVQIHFASACTHTPPCSVCWRAGWFATSGP